MAQISKEYAEALFALACEENRETEFLEALEKIGTILEEEPEFFALLSSPGIPQKDRLSVAKAALEGLVLEYILSWVLLLCEKGRIGNFSECVKEYKALLRAKQSVTTARVTSAVALTDAEADALKQKLEKISGKTVSLNFCVDAEIMGGIIVEMDGKVMDGSIRHRLQELKDVMNK